MELKVWVDGFQRIVCGVTDNTSCQDVVYALAHATGKVGRFTLIERWRSNERHLAPHENPLKILMKWGEYSSDVQFILQRSEAQRQAQSPQQLLRQQQKNQQSTNGASGSDFTESSTSSMERKDVRKSLTFNHLQSEVRLADNVGVVKGVPQIKAGTLEVRDQINQTELKNLGVVKTETLIKKSDTVDENVRSKISPNQKKEAPPYRDPPGHLAPPPYRDPPPPTSPPKPSNNQLGASINANKVLKEPQQANGGLTEINESLLYNVQYQDLVHLINFQREKLSSQQADLNKYDAEIVYLEGKGREQQNQLDLMTQEILQADTAIRQGSEQLQALSYVEEENEIVRQQEKTLKSEITLLRSKLANCETELLQCKNKIRLLMDDVQLEQRAYTRHCDNRQQLERCLLTEVERLQHDIDQAKQGTELTTSTADNLRKEVAGLETAILEKKRQVEKLVNEMKEVNLQSLAVAPADEVKHLLEGPHKPGSTRRMIGSPRQLENAVPTNKNPHGVWV